MKLSKYMEKRPYIVCCICKNERKYIKEFVEYHLDLGFDKIIIGDNNDVNGETYDEILADNIECGEVEIVNLRGQVAKQMPFYNDIIHNYNYEWCAFIDCDEFLTFAEGSKFDNIKDFLDSNNKIKAYAVNWMVYGDNERVFAGEGDVVDRFKKPMPFTFKFHYNFPEDYHIKSILHKDVQANFISCPHNVTGYTNYYSPDGTALMKTSPFNPNMDFNVLYIRHFYTKSLEEWVNKKMKNKHADCKPSDLPIYYPISDFFIYNRVTDAKLNYLKKNGIQYTKKL